MKVKNVLRRTLTTLYYALARHELEIEQYLYNFHSIIHQAAMRICVTTATVQEHSLLYVVILQLKLVDRRATQSQEVSIPRYAS